jgi:N-acetylneuraminate lyase
MTEMIRGLVGAVPTPMMKTGKLNYRLIPRMAELMVNNAVNTVLVGSTSGEFSSLTVKERITLADKWAAASETSLRVLVHVGDTCLDACQAMAQDAQKKGAFGIAACAPYYFKPGSLDELIDYCCMISSSAPSLPFYYYHVPEFTGTKVPIVQFLDKAPEKLPMLAGVIFCSEDLTDFGRCVDGFGKKMNLLLGRDDYMLAGMKMGADGVAGSMCTYAAQLLLMIMQSFKSGDMGTAQNYQVKAVELMAAMKRFGVIQASKAMMTEVDIKCGPVRPPLTTLTPEHMAILHDTVERLGFSEFFNKV